MADEKDDLLTFIDAVGVSGAKASVETHVTIPARPNHSWDKIRLKGAAKEYKRGPGPVGQGRLQQRINNLLLGATRLAKKSQDPDEIAWAERLTRTLVRFNETENAIEALKP